jgi:hypothetical protein
MAEDDVRLADALTNVPWIAVAALDNTTSTFDFVCPHVADRWYWRPLAICSALQMASRSGWRHAHVWYVGTYSIVLPTSSLQHRFFLCCCGVLSQVALQNQPMSWITPLGLPVVQPYRRNNSLIVKTLLQDVQAGVVVTCALSQRARCMCW